MVKGEVLVSPGFFISFILIIIIVCIILIIVQPGVNFKNKDNNNELDPNYFNRPKAWGSTSGKSVTVKNGSGENKQLSGTSTCSLYTYENEFGIETTPSLVNLFQDYYDGLAHQSSSDNLICLDVNQILAYNGTHNCESKIPNTCIDNYGNYVNYGISNEYPVNCRDSLPLCPGTLYSISCNFQLNFAGSLNINSKFLSIDTVQVNDKDYEKLSKEKKYYVDQGYFVKNNGMSSGVFKPTFFNDVYKTNSARQNFKFIRYVYDKSWKVSELGPFAAIIYHPANAYLTADENFNFILKTLDGIDYISNPEPIIQWLMMPSLDLNPGVLPVANKFENGNIKNLSADVYIGSSANQTTDKIYFKPEAVFPGYNDVKINDLIRPLGANLTGGIFSYDGDGNANNYVFPNDNYPNYVFKAINGGESNSQTDFTDIGISVYRNYTTYTMELEKGVPIYSNFLPIKELISLDNISSIALNPSQQLDQEYSEKQGGFCPKAVPADSIEIVAVITNNKIGDFDYGNLIFDNQVVWESINPLDLLIAFDSTYFNQNRNEDDVAYEISFNKANTVKYIEAKEGLVSKVTTTNIKYSLTEFNEGANQILLNNDNCTGLNIAPDPNTNARITLIFEKSQDTNGNPITALAEILVIESGSGYTNNTTFGIKAEALGVTNTQDIENLTLVTRSQDIFYTAISLINGGGVPYNISEPPGIKENGGLVIDGKDVEINNGIFKIGNNIKIDNVSGGNGYQVGDIIYINQIDQFGNSLLGSDYDSQIITTAKMLELASIKITQTQRSLSGTSFPAKTTLQRSIGIKNNVGLTDDDIFYNFNINSPGQYQVSPPQIAFVGNGLLGELKEIIKEGSAEELSSFFASSKKSGGTGFFTDIEYLKTIQFSELNYIGTFPGNFDSDFANNNSISNNSKPILGRFIPYIWFRPPTYKTASDATPNNQNPYIFYNNNYTQLVPTGLKNIYNKFIAQQNLASL